MSSNNYKKDVQQKDTQLKRLIKVRTDISASIYPIQLYQVDDYFTAEENGIELFRFKSQHLCSIKAKELIRRRKNEKNAKIIESIEELKALGIL
jgi:hypothetical protein